MIITRRDALAIGALGGLGAAGLTLPLGASVQAKSASALRDRDMPKPYVAAFRRAPVLGYENKVDADGPYRLYTVTEKGGNAQIVNNRTTPVYGYNGQVPGPTVVVDQGTRAKLRVRNQLPAQHPQFRYGFSTSTHLHGSASLPQYDGYANDITPPGYYKDYEFPNWQPARTIWYHDHNVHTTAQNAYSGLFAQYHIHDPAERDLLPQGHYDVPLTVTDAMFAANGALAYDDNSTSGLWGDVVLVNGAPWPVMKVKRKVYRFRVLNASIARSYTFRLSNGAPLHMVATDGGLMPKAQPVTSYRHAGSERYEFLVDFSKYPVGTTIDLRNTSNKNNVDYDHTNKVMRFVVSADGDVGADGSGDRTVGSLPDTLVGSESMHLTESMARRRTRLRLERDNGSWAINGKTWKDVEDSDFRFFLTDAEPDDVELWEIENSSGGWFHPLHVHLVDFQVLSRNGRAPFAYERGPKDVVYVGEGETVKLLMKFTLQKGGGSDRNAGGKYMVHCHNLPHEDHDMMLQFCVGDDEANDPMASAPARPETGDYPDEFAPAVDADPEPAPEPVEEAPEPAPEPTDEPTSEATPAPVEDPAPAPEPTAEPTADATPEPAETSTPEATATPTETSTPGSRGRGRGRR